MPVETLEGTIERITFHNEETGYTVLRLRPRKILPGQTDRDGLSTVVGSFQRLNAGEEVSFKGEWITHAQYGKQFKASEVQALEPDTFPGLVRYLASGVIRGIGSVKAERIVTHFKAKYRKPEDLLRALNNNPDLLRQVPGLTKNEATIQGMIEAWREHAAGHETMAFLQAFGLGSKLAGRVFRHYGAEAIDIVKRNPYQLAWDIDGIGFRTADEIARRLGLPEDSSDRITAGIAYTLEELANDGHVFAPRPLMIQRLGELLALPAEESDPESGRVLSAAVMARINDAIATLAEQQQIFIRHVPDNLSEDGVKIEAIYPRLQFLYEVRSAAKLRMISVAATRITRAKTFSWVKFFSLLAREDKVTLTDQQQAAVEAALTHKVSVLTGGPGTGKTTTLRAVIKALEAVRANYALASPTGRAAKRLAEATNRPASTLHRLLGYQPEGGFLYSDEDPLDVDMLIIDEASMLDQFLLYFVLRALHPGAHILFVGDVDQLPSVGAGDVLRDIIRSGVPYVTRLNVIFRQEGTSQIVANAHRINKGEMPSLDNRASDFFIERTESPEQAADLVMRLVSQRLPNYLGVDPINDIQVLVPMYKGAAGIQVLNERLQEVLNPKGAAAEVKLGSTVFRVGDKVMQTKNNYEKDVFNGDIGRIYAIDFTNKKIQITIDDKLVDYRYDEMDNVVHAYAISVHKSQGSEYPVVVMLVMPQHFVMLQRNLLYTGVTRAKKMVVLVGTERAIGMAVNNDRVARRYTALAWRLIYNAPEGSV